MPIQVTCNCGRQLKADPRLAGKSARCPSCRAMLSIPKEEDIAEMDVEVVDEQEAKVATRPADDDDDDKPYGLADGASLDEDDAPAARVFAGETGAIELPDRPDCLAYSNNDRWAAAGIDRDVQVLNMKSHKRAFQFRKHHDSITGLAFSPDSRLVLSGDNSGELLLWDLETRKILRGWDGHDNSVTAIAFSPTGHLAVTGGKDGCIRLWAVETGKKIRLEKAKWEDVVRCVCFSPDKKTVAAGGPDGRVSLWDVASGECSHHLGGASGTVTSLTFSSSGDAVIGCGVGTLSGKSKVWRWSVQSGRPLPSWENPSKADCLTVMNAVVPGGAYLVSVGIDATPDPNQPSGLDTSNPLKCWNDLASGRKDYRFQLHNTVTGQRVQNNRFNGHKPYRLIASPRGSRALLATARGRLQIWGLGQQ